MIQRPPSLRYIATAAVIVFLIWGAMSVLASMQDILLLSFIGVLLAAFLNVPVTQLSRHMPRVLATLITILALLATGAGILVVALPTIAQQAEQLIERAPAALDTISEWWASALGGEAAEITRQVERQAYEQVARLAGRALPAAIAAATTVSLAFILLILAAFLAGEPSTYVRGMLTLVPPPHRARTSELLRRLGDTLQGWIIGAVIGMVIVGTLTSIGLLILGVESWFVLGIIAFFGEFIPYAGPVLSAVPAVALALTESPTLGLYVVLLYVIVQHIESLVMPLVMKRVIRLQPALLIAFQLAMGAAFGFLGVIVATPLLACLKVVVGYLYVEPTNPTDPAPTTTTAIAT